MTVLSFASLCTGTTEALKTVHELWYYTLIPAAPVQPIRALQREDTVTTTLPVLEAAEYLHLLGGLNELHARNPDSHGEVSELRTLLILVGSKNHGMDLDVLPGGAIHIGEKPEFDWKVWFFAEEEDQLTRVRELIERNTAATNEHRAEEALTHAA